MATDYAEFRNRLSDAVRKARLSSETFYVFLDRKLARRSWALYGYCYQCGIEQSGAEFDEDALEDCMPEALDVVIAEAAGKLSCSRCLGLVDGLTPAQCFDRLDWNTRLDGPMRFATGSRWTELYKPLTPRQLETARAEWSRQLRERVAASAEKERCRVLVDIQEDD